MFWFMDESDDDEEEARDEIVVETLTEIPVTVRLLVRFEIADGAAPAARRRRGRGRKPAEVSAKEVSGSATQSVDRQ